MPVTLRVLAIAATLLLVAGRAGAEPARPSVSLLAGYGTELGRIGAGGLTAYGPGVGMRAGATFDSRIYAGGTFVMHVGSLSLARDAKGTSSYRASYHTTRAGFEVGYDGRAGPFVLRPYLGGGPLLAFGATAVRGREIRDDRLAAYVEPGFLAAYAIDRWRFGVDARLTIDTGARLNGWAPSALVLVGVAR
jgi:hypothetical protein